MPAIGTTTESVKVAEKILTILNSDEKLLVDMNEDPEWARRTVAAENLGADRQGCRCLRQLAAGRSAVHVDPPRAG